MAKRERQTKVGLEKEVNELWLKVHELNVELTLAKQLRTEAHNDMWQAKEQLNTLMHATLPITREYSKLAQQLFETEKERDALLEQLKGHTT